MSKDSKVLIGIPVYQLTDNSINTIIKNLNQEHRNIYITICVEPEKKKEIVKKFYDQLIQTRLWIDNRVSLSFNLTRLGLISNWNLVKKISYENHSDLDYFCWFSDHDEYGENYITNGVKMLNSNSEYVSCFPNYGLMGVTKRIKIRQGRNIRGEMLHTFSPGSTIYGLHRGSTIKDLNLQKEYLPDRLFMIELGMRGKILEYFTNDYTYNRVILENSKFSLERQSRNLFGNDIRPSMMWQKRHYDYLRLKLSTNNNNIADKRIALNYVRNQTLFKNQKNLRRIYSLICKDIIENISRFVFGLSEFEIIWSEEMDVNILLNRKINLYNLTSLGHLPYIGNLTTLSPNSIIIVEKRIKKIDEFEIDLVKKLKIKMILVNRSSYGIMGIINKILSQYLSAIFLIRIKNKNWPYVKRNIQRSLRPVRIIAIIMFIPNLIPVVKNLQIKFIRYLTHFTFPIRHAIFDNFDIDSVMVTPGNMQHSKEIVSVIFAKRKNIKSGITILSWDNTNSKGTFPCLANQFFCWNINQKMDLIDLHKIPKNSIEISGPLYLEKWENIENRNNSLEFSLSKGGYILFLGSSLNVFPSEILVLKKIKEMLDLSLYNNNLKLYYRPHPGSIEYSKKIQTELDELGIINTGNAGTLITNLMPNQLYIDLIQKANLITGLNTSAFIDCVLLGSKVYPLIYPKALQYSVSHFSSAVENQLFEPVNLNFFKEMNITKFETKITDKEALQRYLPNIGKASSIVSNGFYQKVNFES